VEAILIILRKSSISEVFGLVRLEKENENQSGFGEKLIAV